MTVPAEEVQNLTVPRGGDTKLDSARGGGTKLDSATGGGTKLDSATGGGTKLAVPRGGGGPKIRLTKYCGGYMAGGNSCLDCCSPSSNKTLYKSQKVSFAGLPHQQPFSIQGFFFKGETNSFLRAGFPWVGGIFYFVKQGFQKGRKSFVA